MALELIRSSMTFKVIALRYKNLVRCPNWQLRRNKNWIDDPFHVIILMIELDGSRNNFKWAKVLWPNLHCSIDTFATVQSTVWILVVSMSTTVPGTIWKGALQQIGSCYAKIYTFLTRTHLTRIQLHVFSQTHVHDYDRELVLHYLSTGSENFTAGRLRIWIQTNGKFPY